MAIIYTFKESAGHDLIQWAKALQDKINPNWSERALSTACLEWAAPPNEDGTPKVTKPVRVLDSFSIEVMDGPGMFDNVVMHMHWAIQLAKISGMGLTFLKSEGRLRVTVSQNTNLETLLAELRGKMSLPASQFKPVEDIGPAER